MTQLADYELVSLIGRGNHGSFFRAKPPGRIEVDEEFVAVKVLDHKATDDDFRRFGHEMKVIATVDSRYVAPLLDAGQSNGTLFYTLPYYQQGSLQLADVDLRSQVRAVADAARGAHDLHEIGVVHRDIKPANILVDDGRGFLADLGLASVGSLGTATVGIGPIGSIEFMEPEIVYGQAAGRTSDVWSLAITLHRILSGQSCHPDLPTDSAMAAFRHVLQRRPQIDHQIDDQLATVLSKALAPTRTERFSTALEFADALERAGSSRSQ
ncbi:MAG: serine/threonine protein kinase [Actinobacteria bacterium]|nr:serine/threonine protein kinase [Actinomycetota bacterium]